MPAHYQTMQLFQPGKDIQNDKAFVALFDVHWNEVYRICYRMTGDEEVSKDLTQNIFLSVWERGTTFSDPSSASQYLSKCARYQVLNHMRNQKTTIVADEYTGAENAVETNRYNPELQFIRVELNDQMNLRIASLPEPGKTIFLLSREQNLCYREIAASLNIAVKTVEKYITKSLKILRGE